jgi:UDP-N-acetylmuramoyl-tripeptide--D-alanyl-D-alanine ligase
MLVIVYLAFKLKHDLHMLQQNSYRNERYLRWRKGHRRQEFGLLSWLVFIGIGLPLPLILGLVTMMLYLGPYPVVVIGTTGSLLPFYLLLWLPLIALFVLTLLQFKPRPAAKKPLVMTMRARRLYFTALFVALLWVLKAFVLIFISQAFGIFTRPLLMFLCLMPWLLFWLIMPLSGYYLLFINLLLRPVETSINNKLLNEARQKLANWPTLKKVGITGSYGKTTCKMMLAAMLSEQYITLATPGSVNTPMGLTRIIREQLKPINEAFIAEMGAREPGNIQELMELVQPKMGMLTAIGQQHMDTFGSQEAIIHTKFELIRSLPADGKAIMNMDNEFILANLHQAPCQVIGYSLDNPEFYHAEDIRYDEGGLSFTMVTPEGERQEFKTKLLGKHNVHNIVGSAAAAYELGLPLAKAAQAMRSFPGVEHRLQLMQGPGYTIIDDSFNSNPAGAAEALEVLSQMQGGKRILVTPGMVELGDLQDELNREFARKATAACDYIILVGKQHSKPLQDGLADMNYPLEQTSVVASLEEARGILQNIIKPGDTVLFENDLPDTYNE